MFLTVHRTYKMSTRRVVLVQNKPNNNYIQFIVTFVVSIHISLNIQKRKVIKTIVTLLRFHWFSRYPTVNPETVWRPYTTTSKNYLQTTNTTFVTGDSANWPLEKMERLWLDVLPDVGTSKSFASEPDIKVIKQSGMLLVYIILIVINRYATPSVVLISSGMPCMFPWRMW